jgi:hypothetical protein
MVKLDSPMPFRYTSSIDETLLAPKGTEMRNTAFGDKVMDTIAGMIRDGWTGFTVTDVCIAMGGAGRRSVIARLLDMHQKGFIRPAPVTGADGVTRMGFAPNWEFWSVPLGLE